MNEIPLVKIQKEVHQDHSTRIDIIKNIEKLLKRRLVAFFTTFRPYPAGIADVDANMLENILQKMKLDEGLTLMISSPGGDGLASERIVNVCRAYSSNDFEILVPGQAKSAATMICFGTNKILMSKTSELGPIDSQITVEEDGHFKVFSVYDILGSYESLFDRAVKTKGNTDPFLLQLRRYDEREIAKFKRYRDLSEDIAIKLLKLSMMRKLSKDEILKKMKIFIIPEATKVHGRPIFIDESKKAGLVVEEIDVSSPLWEAILAYSSRLNYLISNKYLKIMESAENSFSVPIPRELLGEKQ